MSAREYTVTKRSRVRPPTHPGELLREDVLPAMGLSVAQAAEEMGVTRQTLHRVLAERTAISPEMAVRLGKFCGNGGSLWLRMQSAHDLWHAERRLTKELRAIPNRGKRAA